MYLLIPLFHLYETLSRWAAGPETSSHDVAGRRKAQTAKNKQFRNIVPFTYPHSTQLHTHNDEKS